MVHRMHEEMHNMQVLCTIYARFMHKYAKLCKIMHVMHPKKAQAGGENQNASGF